MAEERQAAQSGDRTGDDNGPALALLDQARDRGLDGVEDAGVVDVERFLPLLGRNLPRRSPRTDPGVRDDHVEPAERRDAVGERLRYGRAVADVSLGGDDLAAQALNIGDHSEAVALLEHAHGTFRVTHLVAEQRIS